MFTKLFWRGAVERGAKSAAQALILFWAIGEGLLNLWTINPLESVGIAGGAFVLSVLTSMLSLGAGPADSPSLVHEHETDRSGPGPA